MKFLVGCPLVGNPSADRNWALVKWYSHLVASCDKAGLEPTCIFTIHPDDHETRELLKTFSHTKVVSSSFVGGCGDHKWNQTRYHQMVQLRNELLNEVRLESPDLFFSLDSDVLIHPDAIGSLLDALDQKPSAWAVGAKCFVSKHGVQHPNMGVWVGQRPETMYRRYNYNYLVKVDILICCYLMRPSAYNIDYIYNSRGEDIGWSIEVARQGGELFWDGRVANKHVMDRRNIDTVDSRVGY